MCEHRGGGGIGMASQTAQHTVLSCLVDTTLTSPPDVPTPTKRPSGLRAHHKALLVRKGGGRGGEGRGGVRGSGTHLTAMQLATVLFTVTVRTAGAILSSVHFAFSGSENLL